VRCLLTLPGIRDSIHGNTCLLEGDAYKATNPKPADCRTATVAGNSRITSHPSTP
jgi:hypothetical protein